MTDGSLGEVFSETNFEVNLSEKDFGYGGLGKFKVTSHEPMTGNLKIVAGFLTTGRDRGAFGFAFSLPNITLLDYNETYDGKESIYYVGKDFEFKGSIISGKLESPGGDYKFDKTWNIGGKELPGNNDVKFAVGAPLVEASAFKSEMSKYDSKMGILEITLFIISGF